MVGRLGALAEYSVPQAGHWIRRVSPNLMVTSQAYAGPNLCISFGQCLSRVSIGSMGLGVSPGHWAHREPAPRGEPAI
jgi:hypothetical protein